MPKVLELLLLDAHADLLQPLLLFQDLLFLTHLLVAELLKIRLLLDLQVATGALGSGRA